VVTKLNYIGETILTFKSQWSLYAPSGLTFNNSTFCLHTVYMCFVWIWEKQRLFPCTTLTGWFV